MTGAYLGEDPASDPLYRQRALELAVQTVTSTNMYHMVINNPAAYIELLAEHYYYFMVHGKFKKKE